MKSLLITTLMAATIWTSNSYANGQEETKNKELTKITVTLENGEVISGEVDLQNK